MYIGHGILIGSQDSKNIACHSKPCSSNSFATETTEQKENVRAIGYNIYKINSTERDRKKNVKGTKVVKVLCAI